MEDDPFGNVVHCAEHGVSREEIEQALENPLDRDVSRTTGFPVIFGETVTGRHLIVVFEEISLDGEKILYPITAYEVPPEGTS